MVWNGSEINIAYTLTFNSLYVDFMQLAKVQLYDCNTRLPGQQLL